MPAGTRDVLPAERPIEKLAGSPLTFFDGCHVTRVSREVRISERDSTERGIAQDIAEGGLPVLAKKESRLRAGVGMTPAIENDSGNIAFCVKVGSGEHIGQLLTNLALVLTKGSGNHLGAATRLLLFHRQPRPTEKNFQRKNHRRVRTDFPYFRGESRNRANASVNAHSFEPVTARDAHSVEEPPIAQRDVRDQAWRTMELIVSVAPCRVEIE